MFSEKNIAESINQRRKSKTPIDPLDQEINAAAWQENAVSAEKKSGLKKIYGLKQKELGGKAIEEFNKKSQNKIEQ
jgi:hypothetical protein